MYTIASHAPTNTSNVIKLESVVYSGSDITLPIWKNPLIFIPLYQATIASGTPVIGVPNSFGVSVTGTHPTLVPVIISTLKIGD